MSNSQIVTFGCRLNIYESEVIRKNLDASGLKDAVIINTCAVTKEAERQARQAIRKIKRENNNAQIIVTGCAAQNNPKMFSDMPEVSKVIGNEEKLKLESYHLDGQRTNVTNIMEVKEATTDLVSSFDGKARAFIQVQNGCDHRCTFCIIPYGRGNSRSVPLGKIVEQVRLLVNQGYQEIVLTGVDVTSYGPDLPGQPTFSQMIKRLLALVPELPRLRLSSIDVAEIDEDLFNLLAYEPRMMPHLHISLQAGDNMILKRMKRRHNREQVLEFCHKLRRLRPEVSFGADIIAGFPTETDEMFENTRKLVSEAGLQFLHVFPYSERSGTPAARMPQIDKKIRKDRAAILRHEGDKELEKFKQNNINCKTKIVLEKENIGRAENHLLVKIDSLHMPGSIVKVEIYGLDGEYLLGKVVNDN